MLAVGAEGGVMFTVKVFVPDMPGRYVKTWSEVYSSLKIAVRVAQARANYSNAVVVVLNRRGQVVAKLGLAA
jgi:hypothetical protein